MRLTISHLLRGAAIVSLLAVAACDSPEQRAQSHYERGVSLIAEGEEERAALEFRSALQADRDHLPTIAAFADLLRSMNDMHGASRQYSRLVALDAENTEAYLALAHIALELQDFAGAESYIDRAVEIDPDSIEVKSLEASVAFRRGDPERALDLAMSVLEVRPDDVAANMVVIAERMVAQDYEAALRLTDTALEMRPDSEDLHVARLTTLQQMDDDDGIGQQLRRMADTFPDRLDLIEALARWHMQRGEQAEALLLAREIAEATPDSPDGYLGVAQFLLDTEGPEAARAELERQIAAHADPLPFQLALAQLDFATGRSAEALSVLEDLVSDGVPTPELRNAKVSLAQLYEQSGRVEDARAAVDAVLEADDRHVGALKMRARWRIAEDLTAEALADLRLAGMEAPRDPEVMTLMAAAHEREGANDLLGERLARAVEASGNGTGESLRYARFLIREQRLSQAEGVVVDALRRAPNNVDLLLALGQIHIQRQDYTRARQVVGILRDAATPNAANAAAGLELTLLQAQNRLDEAVTLLERLAEDEGGSINTRVGLVQARIASGDVEGAEAVVAEMLAEDPDNLAAKMLSAGIDLIGGRTEEAEALYLEIIEARPDLYEPYQILFTLYGGMDRMGEAEAILVRGLAATDRASALLASQAALHYRDGKYEEAIAIFEEMYARDTSDVVTANNLASLLSTRRDDAESLDRAFHVARRLRGTDVPHFQDTYGWLLVRRGDPQQALNYLQPAAAALGEDPLVQFHLGIAHFELRQWDEAEAALQRALTVAGEGSAIPQMATARERLSEIETLRNAPPGDG